MPVVLVEAFKARRETLRFPAAPDAAGTHCTSLCLKKKNGEKQGINVMKEREKKITMSHVCQVTKLKPTIITLMSVSVGSSLCWRCFNSPLVQFWREKKL